MASKKEFWELRCESALSMTRKSATRITSLTNSLDEALCVVLRKSERLRRILRFQVQFYILQNHAKLREFYLIFLLSRTERSDFHKVPSSQKCCKRERPLPAVREIDKESTQHRFNLSIFERSICIYNCWLACSIVYLHCDIHECNRIQGMIWEIMICFWRQCAFKFYLPQLRAIMLRCGRTLWIMKSR